MVIVGDSKLSHGPQGQGWGQLVARNVGWATKNGVKGFTWGGAMGSGTGTVGSHWAQVAHIGPGKGGRGCYG